MKESGKSNVKEVMDGVWEWILSENPIYATFIGDQRYDDRMPDISKERKEKRRSDLKMFKQKASDTNPKNEKENIDKKVLLWFIDDSIEELDQDLEDFNIDHMNGYHLLPFDLLNFQKTDTPERMEKFIERLNKFPNLMRQHIENLKIGESKKRVQFYIQVQRCIEQIENILKGKFEETPFQETLNQYQGGQKDKYENILKDIYNEKIKNSLLEFVEYLKRYKPRDKAGINSIPDGDKNYRYLIKHHTNLEIDPASIHQLGIDEIKKIHDEIKDVGAKLGVRDGEVRKIIEEVRKDKKNFFSSREEIVRAYTDAVEKIYHKLPDFFGVLPKAKVVVRPVEDYREKDSVGAFYYRPSQDGSRPGIFYINTYKPEERPRYELYSLAVHEAVPGHHLQISISQEVIDHPFRKHIDWDAFTEGWGLYSERLGDEMGLYTEPIYKFGMLIMQVWRAVRLVVDTGIHSFGWSREKSIEFFLHNTGLENVEVINEVDRYITWPAQALAYYIGMKKIMELREKALRVMSIKEFHDLILSLGGIPIQIIEEVVLKRLER
ncbi:MAG: DUF885 domain-containing protein [Candidatus Calescibacterium sp.]|nr:DUF885 domain-containing protein [Candidatus Calescibacterium sp.]MCX7733338.1 DUF885 domain-containing protein [bacterium]